MKTEFLEKLIPSTVEGRDEIIKQIFAENGKDVNAEKAKYADYDTIKTQLADAKTTITTLESTKGEATAMKAELDRYKAADEQRKKDEDAAKARKETESRFDAAVGTEKKFVHEYVRAGVIGEFEKALTDPANTGKSDKEIFDTITKDKDYFASQNPPGNMGGANGMQNVGGVEAAFLARNPGLKI
jgi:predicted lipid-binding transport protein (Tim44 family)